MIATYRHTIPGEAEEQLEAFEKEFDYPLDSERRFRISHSPDYLRFFRAMGSAACFVARAKGRVQGVLTGVDRTLTLPDSTVAEALYLCDLKVAPGRRRGLTFFRLVGAARQHYGNSKQAAYGVVMAGTDSSPMDYTGKWGVPLFQALGQVAILRIPVGNGQPVQALEAPLAEVSPVFDKLSLGRVRARLGSAKTRSRFPAQGLLHPKGLACGVLEDTLQSKRLLCGSKELLSGHLSNYAYSNPRAGALIVRAALNHCQARGLPALFLSIPHRALAEWLSVNNYPGTTVTGATIFGAGLPADHDWNLNTAEV